MSSIRVSRPAAVLLAGVCLAHGGAAAQEPEAVVDDPLLKALLVEASAHSPDLAAAREAAAGARARPEQAGALPDPMLSVVYTNDGWSPSFGSRDMTALAVMWSQDLPFPGKRSLRANIASLEADVADQRLARAELSLAAAVQRAYYGLLQSRDGRELVHEQGEVWREIEGVARARYAVGQGAQQDVLRVQVEVTRIEQLAAEQAAEEELRLAELNRLLGRPAEAALETAAHLMPRPKAPELAEALAQARAKSPELKAARLGVERDRAAVGLARRDFKPDFTVQAGYMNRGSRGIDPMWQAGVGVTLPLYRKKRERALAEAEAQLRGGERSVEAVELQLRFRTQERLAQMRAADRIAELYAKGVIPQDRMAVEAGIANYQAGKVPFVTVLESLASLYGDRTTYLRLLAGHARAEASLAAASLEATADVPSAVPATGMGSGVPSGAMADR
jgi:outer membrane protein TolC